MADSPPSHCTSEPGSPHQFNFAPAPPQYDLLDLFRAQDAHPNYAHSAYPSQRASAHTYESSSPAQQLDESPFSSDWHAGRAGAQAGLRGPHRQPATRHAHSASAPLLQPQLDYFYPSSQQVGSSAGASSAGGRPGAHGHSYSYSFDSSQPISQPDFTRALPSASSHIYRSPPSHTSALPPAYARAGMNRVASTNSLHPLPSQDKPPASPAPQYRDHSATQSPVYAQPLDEPPMLSAGEVFGNMRSTVQAGGGGWVLSGLGGAAALRFAAHSALAPMLTAHKPASPVAHSVPSPQLQQQSPSSHSPATLGEEPVSPQSQLSKQLGSILLSPSTVHRPTFVSSPQQLEQSVHQLTPQPPRSPATARSSLSPQAPLWPADSSHAGLHTASASEPSPNALGFTGMHPSQAESGEVSMDGSYLGTMRSTGTVGSCEGWGAEPSWLAVGADSVQSEHGAGGVDLSSNWGPLKAGQVAGSSSAAGATDPSRISPITGRPTKISSPRAWPPKDAARRIYYCPVPSCGKVFGRPSAKETHLRSHTGHKPYACPIADCARPFSVFSNLKRHMVVHPCTDFRGISVFDLPKLVWVPPPSPDHLPAGLRWTASGALVGTGLLPGMAVTQKVSVGKRGLKKKAGPRKGEGTKKGKGKKMKVESDAEWSADDEEGEGVDGDGGWGPGASEVEPSAEDSEEHDERRT